MGGQLAVLFNLAAAVVLPVAVPAVLLFVDRRRLIPFAAGACAFAVSQVLLRIPLLKLLQGQAWFTSFASGSPVLFAVLVGGVSAGLFEEGARYLAMRFVLRRFGFTAFGDGLCFGLGHGGFEAVWLAAPALLPNFLSVFALSRLLPPLDLLPTGVERLLTMTVHAGLSLLVLRAARSGGTRPRRLLTPAAAVLLHAAVNSVSVLVLARTQNIWLCEASLFLFAAGFAAFILHEKKKEVHYAKTA